MAPSVPEALKKKRAAFQASLAKKALAQQNAKRAGVLKRRAIIKRAASYAKAYANEERLEITRKRQAKKNGNILSPESPNSPLLSASVVSTRSPPVSRRSFSFSDSDRSETPFLSNLTR